MPQLFSASANGIARLVLLAAVLSFALGIVVGALYIRSSWATLTHHAFEQPVPFSHEHHVGGLGIDCRYCHNRVETSSSAGLPATEDCMTCHSQLWTNAEMLAPVRQSLADKTPIKWRHVNDVADFVYFNHAIHVKKGIVCVTCHGQVDEMPLMWHEHEMQMEWCLDCHRNPEPHLRPKDAVFDTQWRPPKDSERLRAELMRSYDIHPDQMTDCYVCQNPNPRLAKLAAKRGERSHG